MHFTVAVRRAATAFGMVQGVCGVTGEVRLDGRVPDVAAVSAMAAVMAPRGPDASGAWSQGRVALGHRRLKIIDLTEAGAQPMVDPELGLAIAFNGCIYNYQELRRELSGHGYRFFSHSDTEVLLKAYHRWGDDFVSHLQGMFAFAIVERDSGRVVLGRDRLGIKPLYLTEDSHRIRFASTLPALLAGGGVDTRIDPIALHHYMTFHSVVPAPRTILRGVRKVPPASLVAIEPDGRRTITTYWTPDFTRHDDRAGLVGTRLGGRRARRAADRRQAPAGRRRAGRLPAVRRRRLQPDRRPARRGGPARADRPSPSASSRPVGSRATSSGTRTSSPSASAPTTIRSASEPTGCCPRSTGPSAR